MDPAVTEIIITYLTYIRGQSLIRAPQIMNSCHRDNRFVSSAALTRNNVHIHMQRVVAYIMSRRKRGTQHMCADANDQIVMVMSTPRMQQTTEKSSAIQSQEL
jgi:uncharacterized protein YeaC (DUF1315 family)